MFKNFLWYLLLIGLLTIKGGPYVKVLDLSVSWERIKSKILGVSVENFNFSTIIIFLFFGIFFTNLGGLLVVLPQNFIYKLSTSLLIIRICFWLFTYVPIISKGKEKLTLFVIGEIKFPILSLLLSHIEILTHIFRPVTLTARLWVNIWVGHLIIRGISFIFCRSLVKVSVNPLFWRSLSQVGFFLFEGGIISLQTFVFTYLIKVYFEENFHHASTSYKSCKISLRKISQCGCGDKFYSLFILRRIINCKFKGKKDFSSFILKKNIFLTRKRLVSLKLLLV